MFGDLFEGRFHTYCKDLYMVQHGKETMKKSKQNRSKLKRTRGLSVLDLKEEHLDKATKKTEFSFQHNDGNMIKALFQKQDKEQAQVQEPKKKTRMRKKK